METPVGATPGGLVVLGMLFFFEALSPITALRAEKQQRSEDQDAAGLQWQDANEELRQQLTTLARHLWD